MEQRAEKECKSKETHKRLFPICQEHILKGIARCLSLNLDIKKAILKHVFNNGEAKSSLCAARANNLLEDIFLSPSEDEVEASAAVVTGNTGQRDVALISLPKIVFENLLFGIHIRMNKTS